jgi:hypothetical protein
MGVMQSYTQPPTLPAAAAAGAAGAAAAVAQVVLRVGFEHDDGDGPRRRGRPRRLVPVV